jgi:hypothetical protein
MKTILSIPLIILILFTGINVRFATHYCDGSVAATKVSLNGELATCGMEIPADLNSLQATYKNNCCNDIISSYTICNNYFSSSFFVSDPVQQVVQMIYVPVNPPISQESSVNNLNWCIRPPGTYSPNSVALPALCIFRI